MASVHLFCVTGAIILLFSGVHCSSYFQIESYQSPNCTGIPGATSSLIQNLCYQVDKNLWSYVTCSGSNVTQLLCSDSACSNNCTTAIFPEDQCVSSTDSNNRTTSTGFTCGSVPPNSVFLNYWTGVGCTGTVVSLSYYAVDTCFQTANGVWKKYRCCGADIDLDNCVDSACTNCTTTTVPTDCNTQSVFYIQYMCNGTGAGTTGCSSPGFTTTGQQHSSHSSHKSDATLLSSFLSFWMLLCLSCWVIEKN